MKKLTCLLSVFLMFAFAIPASAQLLNKGTAGTSDIHMIDYCDPVTFNQVLGLRLTVRSTPPSFAGLGRHSLRLLPRVNSVVRRLFNAVL